MTSDNRGGVFANNSFVSEDENPRIKHLLPVIVVMTITVALKTTDTTPTSATFCNIPISFFNMKNSSCDQSKKIISL